MNTIGYNALIEKLDLFIRKYYKNQILRGLIYGAAIIVAFFLVVVLLEYFGRFSQTGRTILTFLFLCVSSYTLIRFILFPGLKLFRLGKIISHEEAATVIGTHFSDVKDKLLNTLQLKRMADHLPRERELILAGIEQRTIELRPVPFQAAVDFAANKKYLKYALPPIGALCILLFAAPGVLREATGRLVNFNQEIVLPAPYNTQLLNDELSVIENRDFELRVKTSGNEIPDQLYLQLGASQFLMRKESKNEFSYTLKNVREQTGFRFYGAGFYSENFELEVIPVPKLVSFEAFIDYPSYTGLQDQTIKNTGDFEVPEGSKIHWKFNARNTNDLFLHLGDSARPSAVSKGNEWSFMHVAKQSLAYTVITANKGAGVRDSVGYSLRVKPDFHPLISVNQKSDSSLFSDLFFTGDVKDDYGFSRLVFHTTITSGDKSTSEKTEVAINKTAVADQFYHHFSLSSGSLQPGDVLEYFFEVWDNDGVNGPKASRSNPGTFKIPSADELRDKEKEDNEKIKDDLDKSLKEAKSIQKDLDLFKKNLLEKKEMSWQDKKKMEDLLMRQQKLENNMEQLKKDNEQKNELKNQFNQQDERILEKQERLQELFDQLMSEEMKKLLEDIQKMLEELNKEELQKELDKMEMTNDQLEQELDRAMEQFKQLEWETKMEDVMKDLEKLAEEQQKLAEKTETGKESPEELKKEQDELNEKFEQVKDDLKQLEKLNNELEFPNQMPKTDEKQQDIQKDMKESSDKLGQKQPSKASKPQKDAAKKMKEMGDQMAASMAQSGAEQQQEDMDALRALLENIITLSFDQEGLMSEFKKLDTKDPKYVTSGKKQRKLMDDTKMVEDSLLALAKRVIAIEPVVLHEIGLINDNIAKALENIGERITPKVTEHQQYTMTSFNNLALLLDEALQQMQKESSCNKPGTGNCQKPGGMGSKPSVSDMKKQQESLTKQMEKMKEQLGKGNNKGQNKSGQNPISKELAETAAKQAAIRKEIEKMAQELNKDGSGAGNALKEIAKDMETLEKDLVNKNVVEETLRRQQDIMTRLLKAENAERERDQDEKRKSNEAQDMPKTIPPDYEEYKKRKEKESEFYRSLPPELRPYYRDRVNEYFNNLDR